MGPHVAYAAGVAVGTVVGLVVNDRLHPGGVVVEVVVPGDGAELRQAFHARGWPATMMPAVGITGAATMLFVVVRAHRTDEVLNLIRAIAPDAFLDHRGRDDDARIPGEPRTLGWDAPNVCSDTWQCTRN